jgi:5-enolpyruvylshikimate-3-phosphate synthase
MNLSDLFPVITPAITAAVGYFAGRPHKKAHVENIVQQNKDSEFDRIRAMVNELQEEKKENITELKHELDLLKMAKEITQDATN